MAAGLGREEGLGGIGLDEVSHREEAEEDLEVDHPDAKRRGFQALRLLVAEIGAQVIDSEGQDPERVHFGATVVISDLESGEQNTYRIVGEDEADAKNGTISVTSPLARALLGQEVDAAIELRVPKGTRQVEIVDIGYGSTD